MQPLTIQQVADRASADVSFVQHVIELGAIEADALADRDVHVVALLHTWDAAGLPAETVMQAVEAGELSLDFLDTPAWSLPEPLPTTFRQLAADEGVPLPLLLRCHESIGLTEPGPDDRVRDEDVTMARFAKILLDGGVSEAAIQRQFRIYADNLRRLATAEADLYRTEVERRMSETGVSEAKMMEHGSSLGSKLNRYVGPMITAIYDRHRQHVWAESSVGRAEDALDRAGLLRRIERPPAICVVDLTGFTRLTEEHGDEAAARLAAELATMVTDVAHTHGGSAIRWLGDGGLLRFPDAPTAVEAALEIAARARDAGMPPTHIGIQAGPVVFQDGDVYGRTVNIASRLASHAGPGEVLVSAETLEHVDLATIRSQPIGDVELKGVARRVSVSRVYAAEV